MTIIQNIYDFGDLVYLRSDPNQFARVVTELKVIPGNVIYVLSLGQHNSEHYEFEISTQKNLVDV